MALEDFETEADLEAELGAAPGARATSVAEGAEPEPTLAAQDDVLAEFDEDDDLFNFDELVAPAHGSGDEVDLDDLLADVEGLDADETDLAGHDEAPPRRPTRASIDPAELEAALAASARPEDAPSSPRPARPIAAESPRAEPTAASPRERAARPTAVPIPVPARGRPGLLLLAAVGLPNLIAVALLWKSLGDVAHRLDSVGDRFSETAEVLREETARRVDSILTWRSPGVSTEPEALAVLEQAERELEAGGFEHARERLYSLLAVIDRIDPALRDDAEARARFLVAESWRRQADARAEGRP